MRKIEIANNTIKFIDETGKIVKTYRFINDSIVEE